jgi:hypothetical protein
LATGVSVVFIKSIRFCSCINSKFCFCGCSHHSDFTLAPDWRFSILGGSASGLRSSLLSICLPTGLRELTGPAMATSGVCRITVDAEHRWLRARDDFLLDFGERGLLWYVGNGAGWVIWREIETIAAECFASRLSVSSVTFEAGSLIASLGKSAFGSCSIQSICIASAIGATSTDSFADCENLEDVTFDAESKRSILGESAVWSRRSLQLLCIPSSVEIIAKFCFRYCPRLFSYSPGGSPRARDGRAEQSRWPESDGGPSSQGSRFACPPAIKSNDILSIPGIFSIVTGIRFRLLYRGSRDRFGPRAFHGPCDRHWNTSP